MTLSLGWLGKLNREAANRVRFEPRATVEPGPKGLRERTSVLELRATLVPKCMYGCDIISWFAPHTGTAFIKFIKNIARIANAVQCHS